MSSSQTEELSMRAPKRLRLSASNFDRLNRGPTGTTQEPDNEQDGEPAVQAPQPNNGTTIDLTDDNITLSRTKISVSEAKLGKAVKLACVERCKEVSAVLAKHTHNEGKVLHQRSLGTTQMLWKPSTLAGIRRVIMSDAKALLREICSAVGNEHKTYEKFFEEKMTNAYCDSIFKRDILDYLSRGVDTVKQAVKFFDELIEDLREQPNEVLVQRFGA